MIDRSIGPHEIWGEPDDFECIHGIPPGQGVECWQCRYDSLFDDYTYELEAAEDAEYRADTLAVIADALAARVAELESQLADRTDALADLVKSCDRLEKGLKY